MKKALVILLVLVMSFALLSACGDKTNPGTDPETTGETGSPTEQPVVSGDRMVRVSVSGTPICDPAVGITYSSIYSVLNIYDSLLIPASDNSGDTWPLLAETWEISEDGLTYTFKLKEGVKFHSGNELTASDVVFSMNRMLAIGEGFSYLYDGIVESAEAVGDYSVAFKLSAPYGPFVSTLTRFYVLDEELVMANINTSSTYNYGEFGDYGRDFLITNDAGSGPYILNEVKQQDYLEGVQFADYHLGWDSEAPTAFRMIDNTEASTLRTMLSNKDLEITDNWQSTESLTAMEKIEGVEIATYSTYACQNIFYNNKLAPMDDANIRKAISCLFDYDTIIANIYPGSTRSIGPVNAGMVGANTGMTLYEYNIETAKEYIAASKYASTIGDYEIEFYCISDVADQEKIGLAFQAAAKEVGITVSITKAPYITLLERITTIESTPHLCTLSESPKYDDASATLEARYGSKTAGTIQQGEWIQSAEYDKMLADAMAIVDDNERNEAYKSIQSYITEEECFSGFLADITERVAYRSDYVYWPAAEMAKNGELNYNMIGYHFWFHDFKIIK